MKIAGKISIASLFLAAGILSVACAQEIDSTKTEIYSKLRDKRCNMPLSECNCPEAKEMKGYIDALLETGITKDEIFYKVVKKFSLKTVLDEQLKQNLEKRLVSEVGENRPQITLEPAAFNFGQVDKAQGKVSTIFKLYNKGMVSLLVKNIKASCSCTTASLAAGNSKSPYFDTKGAPAEWQMEVKPNEAADLEVVLDLAHKSVKAGDLIREVMIVSNDPLSPEAIVKVEAKVTESANVLQGQEAKTVEPGFTGRLENGVRVIEVKASKFKFEPDPIVVKLGEKLRLIATSSDVKHGIAISEFKVNVVAEVNKRATVEFIASKEGTFRAHCSVYCGTGHGKMQGTLVVKK